MKRVIMMAVAVLMLLSCQGKKQTSGDFTPEQIEAGAKWIERLIINEDREVIVDKITYEEVMTPRLVEIFEEAQRIFGPSDMTEEEYEVAVQEYRKKWAGESPLKEDDHKLFATGNGETASLLDLKITHKEGLIYDVYIEYDYQYIVSNEISLVPHEDSFRIDNASVEWLKSSRHGEEGKEPYYTSEEREARTKKFEALVESNDGDCYAAMMADLQEFVTPQTTVGKWGKPAFESKILHADYEYYYQECYVSHTLSYTYDAFSASWFVFRQSEEYSPEPNLVRFMTERKGFGFGGIYVGVPECNKETVMNYLKRWLPEDRMTLNPKNDDFDENLWVSFSEEVPTSMTISFSEDGLVKWIDFNCGGCF